MWYHPSVQLFIPPNQLHEGEEGIHTLQWLNVISCAVVHVKNNNSSLRYLVTSNVIFQISSLPSHIKRNPCSQAMSCTSRLCTNPCGQKGDTIIAGISSLRTTHLPFMIICEDLTPCNIHPVPRYCKPQLVVPVLMAKIITASGSCNIDVKNTWGCLLLNFDHWFIKVSTDWSWPYQHLRSLTSPDYF